MIAVSSVAVGNQLSLLAAASLFLKRRWAIVGSAALGGLLGLAVAALQPDRYTSTASFLPQRPATSAVSLGGLGASMGALGISLSSAGLADSPDYYLELLRSRPILQRLATDTIVVAGRRGTIADLQSFRGTPAQRTENALEWLRHALRTSVRRGVVEIRVTTQSPELSERIVARTLTHVTAFNIEQRQLRAAAERHFLEARIELAAGELASAERVLREFLEANRAYESSPKLAIRHDALQRSIAMRQQLLTTLVQQREQARIEQVRNTPVFSVIDSPYHPPFPESRHTLLAVILGAIVGGTLAFFAIIAMGNLSLRAIGDANSPSGPRVSHARPS